MFYDMFSALCRRQGISNTKAAVEIGLSNATPTKWKNTGATPDGSTLAKIAAYFSVSMDFLLGITPDAYMMVTEYQLEDAKKRYEKATTDDEREEIAQTIDALQESLDDQVLAAKIMNAGESDGGTKDMLQDLRDEDRALLEVARGMTPEQVKMMTDFAKSMKGEENE